MYDASSCNSRRAYSGILDGGPLEFIMVVMEANSEGRLFSKTFPVLDLASSKENINEALEVEGTLVEGPTS